jgi:AcrR family transcriptional regulator
MELTGQSAFAWGADGPVCPLSDERGLMKNTTRRGPATNGDTPRGAARREEILEAAAGLFARHGYSNTDTQLLADHLRVGKGTIYRYFASKQDLFLAAVDRAIRQARAHVDAAIAGVEDPLDRIESAVRAYLAFFAAHPEVVELFMQERAQFKDRKKPTYFEHQEVNVERWRALYRTLIAAGRVRDVPVERITDVISDLLYGTMFTNYFAGRRKPFEQQAGDIIDVVFHGILSESERQRRAARRP